jgi:hypothetical protein
MLCCVIDYRVTVSMPRLVSYRDDTAHSTGLTFNTTALHMHLFTSWKRRNAEKKAKEQIKARSDEIDLRLEEEAKSSGRLHNVLLMSSCSHPVIYVRYSYNLC